MATIKKNVMVNFDSSQLDEWKKIQLSNDEISTETISEGDVTVTWTKKWKTIFNSFIYEATYTCKDSTVTAYFILFEELNEKQFDYLEKHSNRYTHMFDCEYFYMSAIACEALCVELKHYQ